MMNLSVSLPPLILKNPVIVASGVLGYGVEFKETVDLSSLGAFVCKGTTLHPQSGNPQPRIAETPSGMLNSIGLENIGVERVIKEKAPLWARLPIPVIVNIAGRTIDEYVELARRLDRVEGVSGLELNISCPNVERGGLEFGADPDAASCVVASVRKVTALPLWVKLSPNVTDIVTIAQAVAAAGADALTLINTLKGMAIDVKGRRPVLATVSGGLSGPAIKPVALWAVYRAAAAVDIPVIGCGGIMSGEDAIEFILAGARAVQVGTAVLLDPRSPSRILQEIQEYMAREGITDINRLVGAARWTSSGSSS